MTLHDVNTGKEFIDAQAILRSCGLGLFDLRVDSLISLYKDRSIPCSIADSAFIVFIHILWYPIWLYLILFTIFAVDFRFILSSFQFVPILLSSSFYLHSFDFIREVVMTFSTLEVEYLIHHLIITSTSQTRKACTVAWLLNGHNSNETETARLGCVLEETGI